MLSSFNLKPGTTVEEFRRNLVKLTTLLQDADLIHSTGPIGYRQKHPVMDTDDERDQAYYFVMSFRDRTQCDRAVEEFFEEDEPVRSIHKAVFSATEDPIFTCWEDIQTD